MVSEQVPGQVAIGDQYAEWREVPAMGSNPVLIQQPVDAHTPPDDPAWQGLPPEIEAEERALVTVKPQADHHIVTGMAALARMSPEDYENAISVVTKGIERVKDFQQRAMVKGEDYGTVANVARPFLHLPGAEKLCLLYGLAARQEVDRIIGTQTTTEDPKTGEWVKEWISPPLAYHVRTYIHLGSFDGPIIAMGYGEANSWETKYRYTWAKSKCPSCGKDLIKGKPESRLKGKYWCPQDKGGCNRTFEPNDERITSGGQVENTDPYSLAETLIQMAAKRSFVAGTRRATGTSGLFTQDEDSPSVRQQAGEGETTEGTAEITAAPEGTTVSRGGKDDKATTPQVAMLAKISREKDLGPDKIAEYANRIGIAVTLPDGDRGAKGRALLAIVQNLTGDQMGTLLQTLETGEVPATPGEPPQDT